MNNEIIYLRFICYIELPIFTLFFKINA